MLFRSKNPNNKICNWYKRNNNLASLIYHHLIPHEILIENPNNAAPPNVKSLLVLLASNPTEPKLAPTFISNKPKKLNDTDGAHAVAIAETPMYSLSKPAAIFPCPKSSNDKSIYSVSHPPLYAVNPAPNTFALLLLTLNDGFAVSTTNNCSWYTLSGLNLLLSYKEYDPSLF